MKTLPERVYFKHGAYYYVTPEKQWIRLGKNLERRIEKPPLEVAFCLSGQAGV